MTEGTASALSEFQQIMNEYLQDIPNTIAYLDNIFVTGSMDNEHIENLRKVCKRFQDCNFRLNKKKCEFFKEKIEVHEKAWIWLKIDLQGFLRLPITILLPEFQNAKWQFKYSC